MALIHSKYMDEVCGFMWKKQYFSYLLVFKCLSHTYSDQKLKFMGFHPCAKFVNGFSFVCLCFLFLQDVAMHLTIIFIFICTFACMHTLVLLHMISLHAFLCFAQQCLYFINTFFCCKLTYKVGFDLLSCNKLLGSLFNVLSFSLAFPLPSWVILSTAFGWGIHQLEWLGF